MLVEAESELASARGAGGLVRAALRLAMDLARTFVREWLDVATAAGSAGDGVASRLVGDVRFALRSLGRSPVHTAVVLLTLFLGIGANTAIFGVVDAVLLDPLPYERPDDLVQLWPGQFWSEGMVDRAREGLPGLVDVAGFGGELLTVTEGGEPVEAYGMEVTTSFFDVLGVAPALGRGFRGEDGRPGAEPVVVLSRRLWLERFGGDPDVLGSVVAIQDEGVARRRVVGVMPAGYRSLQPGVDAWIPVVIDRAEGAYDDSYFMEAVGRLRPGATVDDARRAVQTLARRMRAELPGQFREEEVAAATALSLSRALAGSLRTQLLALFAAVGLVLLIACVNVANLLLARTANRHREMGIRTALGAGRGRIAGQLLTESAVLGLLGGGGGLLVATLGRDLLVGALPGASWRFEEVALDLRVLGFTLAVSLGAAFLFGAAPALLAVSRAPADSLGAGRGQSPGRRGLRLSQLLVSVEVALALVSVFAAVLLTRAVWSAASVDPGFEPEGVVTFRATAPRASYPDDDDVLRYFRDVRAKLAAVPGVESVGYVSRLPMGSGTSRITITPAGLELADDEARPVATHRLVGTGYAESVGMRLREGRQLDERDAADGPLPVVVNATLADRFWPDGALGRGLYGPGGVTWATVVGVVEDVREDGPSRPVLPAVYLPHRDWAWRTMTFTVRARGDDPLALVPALEEAVWSVSPDVPVSRVRTLRSVVDGAVQDTRLTARLFTLFAALALVLGAVGVYGVMAYAATRRRREFGIRTALGAPRVRVTGAALLRAARPLLAGIVAGVVAAPFVGRLLTSLLHGLEPGDPLSIAAGAGGLALVGVVATWLPVRRATGVDPTECLRAE
jgi:predicted permease